MAGSDIITQTSGHRECCFQRTNLVMMPEKVSLSQAAPKLAKMRLSFPVSLLLSNCLLLLRLPLRWHNSGLQCLHVVTFKPRILLYREAQANCRRILTPTNVARELIGQTSFRTLWCRMNHASIFALCGNDISRPSWNSRDFVA